MSSNDTSTRDAVVITSPSLLRTLAVATIVFPLITVAIVQLIAVPDLETWLTGSITAFSRPDAFDHVTRIAPAFACLLAITSAVAVVLVLWHRSQYFVLLSTGPFLGLVTYLVEYGVTDPAWFSLLALLTIGMLVATPVTIVSAVAIYLRRPQIKSQ